MSKTIRRIITTAAIIAVIVVLTIFMVVRTSAQTRENAISHMKSLTNQQSVMILDYVDNAEKTLAAFSTADIVNEYLHDINNLELKAQAQDYTERFSDTIAGVEGLWIGSWSTEVLTHTNPDNVGRITRKEAARLEDLRNHLLEADENVYNTGIIISPALGNPQIVSMYKAVFDEDHQPIGFVGLGIYTKSLATALREMELNTSSSSFCMVNTENGAYIFCDEDELIGATTDNEDILNLCTELNGSKLDKTGHFEAGNNVSFYSFIAGNNWLLSIESPKKEVYAFSNSINTNLIAFCAVCIILIVIFNVISFKQQETVQRLEQSKRKQAAITKNLHTAALKDILTDVNNRIKFIDDFSKDDSGQFKIADCPNNPYCFALISLPRFSQINIMYGHDVGDTVLATTADILKNHFGSQGIYRTGSDEFVVAVQSTSSNPAGVIMEVNSVLNELRRPRKVGSHTLDIMYSATVVKKSTAITPAVLITLKDMLNNTNGMAPDANAIFVDMDAV